MQPPPVPGQESWFHRNPKKTLLLVTAFFLVAIVTAAEILLAFQHRRQGVFLEGDRRYIRLREHRPSSLMMLGFPPEQRKYTDNVFTKKYRVAIDDQGFIMPSRKYPRPDFSLVFLGGSTTECMYVDEENRFPYVVGKILEERTGKKINSYNGGLSGVNSLHVIDTLINKVIPLQPRAVVFMENINDLSTLLYEGTYWHEKTSRAPLETIEKRKLLGKLLKETFIPHLNQAYRDLKRKIWHPEEDEFAQFRGKKLVIDKPRFLKEFEMNLQIFVDICRDRGIIPVLMTQANRITEQPDPVVAAYIGRYGTDTGISYADFKDLYDAFNEAIRRVGQKNRLLVIDLAKEVPPDQMHLYDLVHFNDAGSRLAADIIAARLEEVIAP